MRWLLAITLLFLSAGVAGSQPGLQKATRAVLAERVSTLEQSLSGSGLKGSNRQQVENELALIRQRLEMGDFKVGDRFVVTLNFDSVTTDTASVRDGLQVSLFDLPDMSLSGVLRSELGDRLSAHVSRYLKNATIRANVLTRIGIFGAVARPGYYLASPDRPVSELVMLAGGPTPEANINQLKVERSRRTVISSKDSQRAIKEGRTLEQLDIQSGDDVTIATKRKVNWQLIIQVFFIISSLFFAFIQFMQWYYRRDD